MGIWINETVFFFSVTIEGQRLAGAAVVKFQELKFVILKLLIVLPMESYYVRCSAQGPVVNAGVSREDHRFSAGFAGSIVFLDGNGVGN
ncbi:hypothetical protein ACFX1R_006633 [Malus domestica]